MSKDQTDAAHATAVLDQLRDTDPADLPDSHCDPEGRPLYRGYPVEEIETGNRIMESPVTGQRYRVYAWVEREDGRAIALQKTEVSDG